MVAEVGSGMALVGLAKRAGQRGKHTGPAGWPCGAGLLLDTPSAHQYEKADEEEFKN